MYIHYTVTKVLNLCVLEIKFARVAAKDALIPAKDMPVEFRPRENFIFSGVLNSGGTSMDYHWLRLTTTGKFYTHNQATHTVRNIQATVAYIANS